MKICLITSEFPPVIGGIASHVYELARALIAVGVDVTVVHPTEAQTAQRGNELPGGKIIRPSVIKAQPFYTWQLRNWLKQNLTLSEYDLIHVHGVRPLAAAKGLGVPLVFTNHSSGFLARHRAGFIRKFRTQRLLRGIDYLLGPSDELVQSAQIFGYQGPARMIANGVDATRFKPGPSTKRVEWGVPSDEVVVLLARRLVPKNGVVYFAKAIEHLPNKNVCIVIAGDGIEREEMKKILTEAGRLNSCVFLGSVSNQDMPDIYRASDIAVLPSLAEATSIAGLEAMACGLPLVGTSVGGIPAIIDDGQSGIIVPPRDPKALAGALTRLVNSPELRQDMGKRALERIEKEFSWPMIAHQTHEAYKACLLQAGAHQSRVGH
jgi:glycosyltransferase involved in cell wall biosynthesis